MMKSNNLHFVETEIPTFNVLGLHMQFLTVPDQIKDDISIMRAVIPPGAAIPLHSHADPEIFYLLNGSLEIYQAIDGPGKWAAVTPDEIVSIAGGTKHAIRNSSNEPVTVLIVTKQELYLFVREMARPLSSDQRIGPPTPEEMRQLFAAANKFGYQMATQEENAAIGLFLETD